MKIQLFNPSDVADQSREMDFKHLGAFGGGEAGVFWSNEGGPSPWEMHPDVDELLHVIEGEIDVEVLPTDRGGGEQVTVKAGEFLVVPRGCWHVVP